MIWQGAIHFLKAELSLRKWQTLELDREAEGSTCVGHDLSISTLRSSPVTFSCLPSPWQDWREGEGRCPISQAHVTQLIMQNGDPCQARWDAGLWAVLCESKLMAPSRSCTLSPGIPRGPLLRLQAKHKWSRMVQFQDHVLAKISATQTIWEKGWGMTKGVKIPEERQSEHHWKHGQMRWL